MIDISSSKVSHERFAFHLDTETRLLFGQPDALHVVNSRATIRTSGTDSKREDTKSQLIPVDVE